MDAKLTPTVEAVASELGSAPVPVSAIVGAILGRHTSDYPTGHLVRWPDRPRVAPAEQWLTEVAELVHGELHGRMAILTLALADAPSGRAMMRAGLYLALVEQLRDRFVDGLTPAGLERLAEIPLAGAMAGVAMGAITLAGPINDLEFSPSGQQIAVGHDEGWTLVTKSRRRVVRSWESRPVAVVGFSRDGRDVIAGFDDRFQYFPIRGGEAHLVRAEQDPLAIHAGIAVGEDRVYVDREPAEPFHAVVSAAIARDARVVAGANRDGMVTVWSPDSDGAAVIQAVGPVALALSADGATMVTGGGNLACWDVASGAPRWSLPNSAGTVALSPDGRRVAAGAVALIDVESRELIAGLPPGRLAFNHDGARLAVGGEDGTVRVLDVETGATMAVLRHPAPVTAIVWSPEGDQLVTGTRAGTVAAWAGGLEPAPRRRLAAYSADDTRAAEDLSQRLDIDPDVDALSALLAARAVDPPLSVGLFGDWGSGKTFFMRRLRKRVAELASDARDSGELQKDVAWHKRIVQIEFNAWHYAEGNLWASLVAHILDNLRLSDDEDDDVVQMRRSAVLAQISDQTAVTETAKTDAEGALKRVEERRDELQRDLDKLAADPLDAKAPQDVRDDVLAVARVVLPHVGGETYAELNGAIADTRAALTRGSEVLTPLVRAPHTNWWLLGALAAGPIVAAVLSLVAPGVVQGIAGAAALIGGAVAWFQRQVKWTRERLDEVQRVADELAAPAKELQQQREQEVTRLQAEYDAAAAKVVLEQERLHTLELELAQTTPSRLLARLIAERVQSDDYRRHLGVLALVRRDFEAMSDYLRLQASDVERYETLEEEEADDDVRIGRIVLYIDDLDRCEPAQVVAVLQAVHLLLAFPLFAVVVGVDVRWVERALRLHHQQLLDSDGATPRDYLEKIFQIPFWLEPLDPAGSKAMLRTMIGAPKPKPTTRPIDSGGSDPSVPLAAGGNPAAEPTVEGGLTPLSANGGLPPPRDLRPEALEIGEDELAAMDELAPLLGRSPRALKRFLNTYRLIKVRQADPAAFLREQPAIAPYKATMLLLAKETGVPGPAPWSVTDDDLAPYKDEVARFSFR